MADIFGAYLEDYHYIKLIVPTYEYFDLNNLWLVGNKERIQMRVFRSEQFGNEFHLHTSFKGIICLHKDYEVDIDGRVTYNLTLGKISKTPRFELENYYDGPLGFEYHQDYTIFRVWSPVAKDLRLILVDKDKNSGESEEKVTKEETFFFEFVSKGLWMIKVNGDLNGKGYYFEVRINQRFHRTIDPYGVSGDANNKMNYVIDFKKAYKFRNSFYQTPKRFDYVDAVICEASVRDFTIGLPVEHPGTFLGMIESGDTEKFPNQGLNYLKNLGITHLQLMPIFSFGGIDEEKKQAEYNWGYNPIQFNVPSGYYTTDPNDAYKRVNELRMLVDYLHEMGIAVNMDVVYNHVFDYVHFAYAVLVPGYFFHDDERGYMTNSSGCGNDLATNRKMVNRYIVDSVLLWQRYYKIDGFRFDLMGLIDTDTMNEVNNLVKTINQYAMIYGEGWNMPTVLPTSKRSTLENFWATPGIAYFNDTFRNNIKANLSGYSSGYAMGGLVPSSTMEDLICGSCVNEALLDNPNRSLNYVECHDNYTFYDQLCLAKPNLPDKTYERYVLLSLGVVAFSQGVPFFQIGQEAMRTKKGVENSYNSNDDINKLDWNRIKEYHYLTESWRDMLAIRREYQIFRMHDSQKIKEAYRFERHNSLSKNHWKKEVSFRIKADDYQLYLIFKNDFEEAVFYFAPGAYLIFNGERSVNEEVSALILDKPGAYIVKRA